MLESWLVSILLLLLVLLFLLMTVVFCFWSVYLLDAIQRKWKVNRNSLRCIQKGENDSVQQIIAYNSKTEFVKFVFLFFMNLVEWLGFLFGFIGAIMSNTENFRLNNYTDQSDVHSRFDFFNNSKIHSKIILYEENLTYIPNIFFVLSLILVASLCMYLAERFAQKSWIKSNKIPYIIVFFMISEFGIQISTFFCAMKIIALWCEKFFLILSLLFAIKQYRKLLVIINWSIIDLKVSRNYPLMERQINTKRMFTRLFTFFWIGVFLLVLSDFIGTILYTLMIVLRENTTSGFRYLSLCEESHSFNPQIYLIFSIIHCTALVIGTVGASFLFIPYIGFGLSTMCVILWRLIRGKTGYKTHFHNDLYAPLI